MIVVLENTGAVPHNLVIEDLDVTVAAGPGESASVEFEVPDEDGPFEFICSLPGHKEAGMVGTIVIRPATQPPVTRDETATPSPDGLGSEGEPATGASDVSILLFGGFLLLLIAGYWALWRLMVGLEDQPHEEIPRTRVGSGTPR